MIMQKPIYPIAVHAVAFSPDGRILASGDGTVRLRLWDPATGNLIRDRRAHSNWVSGVAFSPDGRQLASSSGFKLRVFEVASGKEIWPTDFRGVIRGQAGGDTAEDLSTVVFSSDGTTIAVGATNGSVYLVSVNCGELLRQLSLPKE